ncbi:MAG: hypothetical protein WBA97_40335 [Actinophytocola sp.]|uniref:hypothetical protein n=1 Tax=Actinophytocola sp. TaxID=1872138 RepID=UPI003C722F29
MSWDDFTTCAGRDGEILAEIGEDGVKEIAGLWRALPQDVKAMLIASARWGGVYLEAALAAVGIAAAEAIAAVAAGAGLGVIMAVIMDCYDQL